MATENNKKEEIILRDKLALDRTSLANQRTLLSYVRTGLYFIMTGIGLFYLEKKTRFGLFEWLFIVLGLIAILAGVAVYLNVRQKINSVERGE